MQVCLRRRARTLLLMEWVSACEAHLKLLSSQVLLDYLFFDRVAVQERVMGRVRLLSHLLAGFSPVQVRICYPSSQAIPSALIQPQPQMPSG